MRLLSTPRTRSRLFDIGMVLVLVGDAVMAASLSAGLVVAAVGIALWALAGALALAAFRGQAAERPSNGRLGTLVAGPQLIRTGAFVLVGAAVAVILLLRAG
jgi:hypothetical protein